MTSPIISKFVEVSRKNPDLLAVVSEDTVMNFDEFENYVSQFTESMRNQGVKLGDTVVVETSDFLVAIPSVLACAAIGASWVAGKTYEIFRDEVRFSHFFSSKREARDLNEPWQPIDRSWGMGVARNAAENRIVNVIDDDFEQAELIVTRTSGTTGHPKRISLSQEIMFNRSLAVSDDFVERQTVFTSLFEYDAFPYITRALAACLNGCTVVASRDPKVWEMSGVNFVYGSVAQVAQFFQETALPQRISMIHVTGSKHTEGLTRKLLKSFELVVDLYASTETNRSFKNIRSIDANGDLIETGSILDSDVEILDEHGALCALGDVGTVRIRNAYLADGYCNDPVAQAQAFRDGWFYPGDLAYWSDTGALKVVGRKGDVINTGGIKVNAQEIDDTLMTVKGIKDAMCFESPPENGEPSIYAFIVFERGVDIAECTLRAKRHCEDMLGHFRSPERVIEVSTVPRAHDGGAQRFRCQKLYREIQSNENNGLKDPSVST